MDDKVPLHHIFITLSVHMNLSHRTMCHQAMQCLGKTWKLHIPVHRVKVPSKKNENMLAFLVGAQIVKSAQCKTTELRPYLSFFFFLSSSSPLGFTFSFEHIEKQIKQH